MARVALLLLGALGCATGLLDTRTALDASSGLNYCLEPAWCATRDAGESAEQRAWAFLGPAYGDLIWRSAAEHDLSPWILLALLMVESRMEARARHPRTAALGVAQFTTGGRWAVARLTGQPFTAAMALDPEHAVPAAAMLLGHLVKFCGGLPRALRAWHAGACAAPRSWERHVLRVARRLRWENGLPPNT